MKEECWVKKLSFNYGKDGVHTGEDPDQIPKSLQIKTKKTLGKPLGKIDFLIINNNNDILLDALLKLPFSLKNLINVFVWKFFALNIGLNKVSGKFSQEKLVIVRKLFSKVNGFGGVSILSKFVGIIHATFTSESNLAQTTEKTRVANVLVNTNLKKPIVHLNQTVVVKKIPVGTLTKAVRVVLSEFGMIMLIKMQLVELWQKAVVDPGCQLPVTLLLQNYVDNIVMEESLGKATSDKTAAFLGLFTSPKVAKFEAILEDLFALMLSLLAHLDNLVLAGGIISQPTSQ
ncbi:hypothetical protein G9A89_018687 [Geosiphon pyriformis]|nr:hypothetical protein G9A89_018687 [Geosiphon pyriformis]